MNSLTSRFSLPLPLLALLVFVLVLALAAPGASAAPRQLNSGTLDWGFANRWRCYVVGFVSNGSIETTGGVTRVPGTEATGTLCPLAGDGSRALRFPVSGGTYDQESGELRIELGGSVRFKGHRNGSGWDLDTTFADLKLVATGDHGQVLADVTGTTRESPEPMTREDVPLVDLDLSGTGPVIEGDSVSWSAAPAILTAAGAEVFGSYPEGEPFDPVSTSLTLGDLLPEEPPKVEGPPAKVRPGPAKQRLKGNRLVRLGTVACPDVLACVLKAPKRIGLRIGKSRFQARVLAPGKIRKGRSAAVSARVPKAAARRLKGRTATLKLPIRVQSNGIWTRRTLKAKVRKPAR